MQEVLDQYFLHEKSNTPCPKKFPTPARISKFVLPLRNPEKWKNSCPKNMPRTRIFKFVCVAYHFAGCPKTFREKLSSWQGVLSFSCLIIEDSLPEKYVPNQDSLRVYRFLLGGLWGTMKNRRWLARNMPPTCIFRFCRFLLWPKNVETWWKSKISCPKNSPHQDLKICLWRLYSGGSREGVGAAAPLFGCPCRPSLMGRPPPKIFHWWWPPPPVLM
jgi:hypothetical protein